MLEFSGTDEAVLQSGWLSEMPPSFRHCVLHRCRRQLFSSGRSIYEIGDPPGGMYGLVSGGIGVSIAPHEHGPYLAHVAQPGSWFGEASAITGQPRRVGLVATRDTILLNLPLHAIHEIVGKDPGAWRLFALATMHHLDVAIGACDDMRIRDPVKRCIAVLLRLAGHRLPSQTNPPYHEIDLSQEHIAHLANVARTTINAVLRDLETGGKLKRSYRRIRILAPAEMRAMLRD